MGRPDVRLGIGFLRPSTTSLLKTTLALRSPKPIRGDQGKKTCANPKSARKKIMTTEKLKLLARDLRHKYPRSPRETLAGYVLAARVLDKCRAIVAGTNGEYKFDCPLDRQFFDFTGIDSREFREFVATGATDAEVAEWIGRRAVQKSKLEIIKWNNKLRELRISELPDQAQEYLEDYIPKYIPKNRPVYYWFDVYDLEEERI